MRVLVVDDSAFMRKAISLMIESDSSLTVADIARNGEEALEKIKALNPDVVTLDIEMPVMDGMTVLKKLKAEPCEKMPAILVCSTLTKKGSLDALTALRSGAADYVTKDPSTFGAGTADAKKELIAKIKAIGATRAEKASAPRAVTPSAPRLVSLSNHATDVVLIGSSTGGPPVLEEILTGIPADFPVPIVVAQHMPIMFTKSLAERLDETCAIDVEHGEHGAKLKAGTAYIVPGGQNGRVLRGLLGEVRLEVSPNPVDAPYKPSVDELLGSAAKAFGSRAIGVVLTGMGDDGSRGGLSLSKAGGKVLSQSRETCVVYGMPKAIAENGASSAVLSPSEIGAALKTVSIEGKRRLSA